MCPTTGPAPVSCSPPALRILSGALDYSVASASLQRNIKIAHFLMFGILQHICVLDARSGYSWQSKSHVIPFPISSLGATYPLRLIAATSSCFLKAISWHVDRKVSTMKYSMFENGTVDPGHIYMRKEVPSLASGGGNGGILKTLTFHTIVLLSQRGVHPVACVLGFSA